MIPSILRRLGAASSFVRTATKRGLPARVARMLEPAALELEPDRPEAVLESRELLQRAALAALVGDGGNLELSFEQADALAATMDALQLCQPGGVPEPFQRVWIATGPGRRTSGVVLSREGGELGVFCPPETEAIPESCSTATLGYRGFSSSVEFELQLSDSCRFPGGLMVHLSRKGGGGEIGRGQQRLEIRFRASVRPEECPEGEVESGAEQNEILDVSIGGVRMACSGSYRQGLRLHLSLPLPDDPASPLLTTAVVCWSRQDDQGQWSAGLVFEDPSAEFSDRLSRFLSERW